jgi:hypothetical protein
MVFTVLHPFNYPYALLLRILSPVAYWRAEGLAHWLTVPFEAIEPLHLTNSPEWNSFLESAHAALAQQLRDVPSIFIECNGVRADFGRVWLHWFAHQYEIDALSQRLAAAWARSRGLRRCRIARSGVDSWGAKAGVKPVAMEHVERVCGSVIGDRLWELAKSMRVVAGILARSLMSPSRPDLNGRAFRYLFVGVSPITGAYNEHHIDFAFLARRSLLPAEQCLYLLSRPLSVSQAEALSATGAAGLLATSVTGVLGIPARLRLIMSMLGTIIKTLFKCQSAETLVAMLVRGLPVLAAARQAGVEVLIAGLDDGLLEPPAMPLLAAAGVRTVMWQHALVGLTHAQPGVPFRHRTLEQAMLAAEVFCVWTPADRAMLKDRALAKMSALPDIRVTGPIMSGDARWLQRSKDQALTAARFDTQANRKMIVLFDLPNFDPNFLRTLRIVINRVSEDAQNAFFQDLSVMLERFPEIDIAIKPKRGDDRRIRKVETLQQLVDPAGRWMRSGRIKLFEFNVDPYLPIAVADLCIGMPFTSPVAAAVNAGRAGLWYDPIGFVQVSYPNELEMALVRGREKLEERLASWLSGVRFAPPACLISGIADPGAELAAVITGVETDRQAPLQQVS